MAYFSLHAYDADVWIQQFLGLRQIDETLNADPQYATEVRNVETPNGVLQPHAGPTALSGQFTDKVETIARFYRRWYDGAGSKSWMICASGGKLYYRQDGGSSWMEIVRSSQANPFASNVWSWCTYEMEAQGVDHPVDVMIMSNAEDGMIVVSPPDRPSTWGDALEFTWGDDPTATWGDEVSSTWLINTVDTKGKKFGVIERYAERIWGGAIPGDPDMLMYSAPYDPTDWEQNTEIPEDGAGSIQQPSWDGDSFTALRAFGDQLIAFKEHRVWRVYGTNPGEYVFSQQFGGGAPFVNTIAVDVEKIFMADINGLSVYDGMSVTPFQRKLIEPLWRRVNRNAMNQMCGVLFRNKYYLAVPVD